MDFDVFFESLAIPIVVFDPTYRAVSYANNAAKARFNIDFGVSRSFSYFIKPKFYNDLLVLEHIIKTDRQAKNFHITLKDDTVININGSYYEGQFIFYIYVVGKLNDEEGLTESSTTSVRESEVMGHILRALYSESNTDKMINAILKTMALYLKFDRVYIYERSDDMYYCTYEFLQNDALSNIAWLPEVKAEKVTSNSHLEQGLYKIINNIFASDEQNDLHAHPRDVKSYVHFPLMSEGKLLGLVGCDFIKNTHEWKKNEIDLVENISAIFKELLKRTQLEKRVSENSKITATVLDNLDLPLYVVDYQTDALIFANQRLRKTLNADYTEGEKCWKVLFPGKAERCDNCMWKYDSAVTKPTGVTGSHDMHYSYGNYWIMVKDRVIEWVDGRLAVLILCIDIDERKKLEKELEFYASIDLLTGAYNRTWGLKLMQEAYDRALAGDMQITACFMDIDKLKVVNDLYGHTSGDVLIKNICDIIKRRLDPEDIFIRFGGDEFIIVFGCDFEGAKRKISLILEELDIYNTHSKLPYVHEFCYGLENVNLKYGATLDDIILLIDNKMYEQKKKKHL